MENQVAQLEHWTARNPPLLTHFFNSIIPFRRCPSVGVGPGDNALRTALCRTALFSVVSETQAYGALLT